MARSIRAPRRKPRLRTELSAADEEHLKRAMELYGLPKAEVVRRLIRRFRPGGPGLVGREHQGRDRARAAGAHGRQKPVSGSQGDPPGPGASESKTPSRSGGGLHEVVAAINDELTEMTVAYGSKLRREAKLTLHSVADEAAP